MRSLYRDPTNAERNFFRQSGMQAANALYTVGHCRPQDCFNLLAFARTQADNSVESLDCCPPQVTMRLAVMMSTDMNGFRERIGDRFLGVSTLTLASIVMCR